jgi:hypothetical protein
MGTDGNDGTIVPLQLTCRFAWHTILRCVIYFSSKSHQKPQQQLALTVGQHHASNAVEEEVLAFTHLKCCKQLDNVFMVAGAVQADLPVNLVLVQLADAAHQVALEHHHLTAALAHGLVHCSTPSTPTKVWQSFATQGDWTT